MKLYSDVPAFRTNARAVALTAALAAFPTFLSGCSGDDGVKSSNPGTSGSPQANCDHTLSDYAGDCQALPALDASKGVSLHFGPSDYKNKDDIARFLLDPKKEQNVCLYMTAPNDQDIYFNEYHGTVRPGSHHMIIFAGPAGDTSSPPDGTLVPCLAFPGLQFHFVVGVQNGIGPKGGRIDFPNPSGPVPEENKGLAYVLKAHARIAYQVHYINTGDEPILQESWANLVSVPLEQVKQMSVPLWWIGGLRMNATPIQPGTTAIVSNQCTNSNLTQSRRLVGVTGHAHAHTTRISAWKIPAGGTDNDKQLVYQEFNWSEAKLFYYDSVTTNPQSDLQNRIPGASSGPLILNPGDTIKWECEVHNTLSVPLKFGNEAFDSEMCNLFGAATPGDGPPGTPNAGNPWACYGG